MSARRRLRVRALRLAAVIVLPASCVGVLFCMLGVATASDLCLFMASLLCLPTAILMYAVPSFLSHLGGAERVVLFALTQFSYHYLAALLAVHLHRWYRGKPYPIGHCQKCGYNLTGNVSGRCSECGTDVGFDYHAIRAAQLKKCATWLLIVLAAASAILSSRMSRTDSLSSICVWGFAVVVLVPSAVWLLLRKR